MFKSQLIQAFRSFSKRRAYSSINVIGLTMGFFTCLIIALYVNQEFSYDRFHKDGNRIYRINQTYIWGDQDLLFGSTGPAVKQALLDEIPEFESVSRVHTPGLKLIGTKNPDGSFDMFDEEEILAVDDNFLQMFTFPMISGDPGTALSEPYSLVITESTGVKYFGKENPVGKQLWIGERGERQSYLVRGVVNDVPSYSHIQFDFLMSMNSIPRIKQANDSWMWTTFVTFGKLRPDADPGLVEEKVAEVPAKYLEGFLQKYRGISYEEFLAAGDQWDLYIQPLWDIHLNSTVYSRLNDVNDKRVIYISIMVGIMVLVLSLINYVNLATARAGSRAKEIGVRKIIGSSKFQLINQFLIESFFYASLALILALIFVEIFLPLFNQLIDTNIELSDYLTLTNTTLAIVGLIGISLLGATYPAWVLSSFSPSAALKGQLNIGQGGGRIRNMLVVIQFAISILMIANTLIIYQQVSHWQNLDLGFDRENQVILRNTQRLSSGLASFTEDIRQMNQVAQVSISSDGPPSIFDFDNFTMRGVEGINLSVNYVTIDEYFIDAYGLQIVEGRNFSKNFNDSSNVIVNHQLAKSFGFHDPGSILNREIVYNGTSLFKIVGLIEDFESSLNGQTYPTIFFDQKAPIFRNPSTHVTIKLNQSLDQEASTAFIDQLTALWNDQNSDAPLHYSFSDIEYERLFKDNIQFGKLMLVLAVFAISIACMGLVGLASYVLERRRKEIGVRKVLGATVESLWLLLSSNFGKLLAFGLLLGGPTSWWIMNEWMSDFEVKTEIGWWPIIVAAVLMLMLSLLATSWQVIKAAMINPIEYLHEE